jgi:hypothetical protein
MPPNFGPAFNFFAAICVAAGVAAATGLPWLWDVAIKPALRALVL